MVPSFSKTFFQRKATFNTSWPQGYKTFFMLNLVQHESLNAHKYKKIKKMAFF